MVFYKQTSKISPGRKQQALKILKETTRNENDCNTGLQDCDIIALGIFIRIIIRIFLFRRKVWK